MIVIDKIDTNDRKQVDRFIKFQFDLYDGCPQWVPPFYNDIRTMLTKNKHPFYEHSDAEFFMAVRDGKDVGRIAALENKPFNNYHKAKDAEFYFFDSLDDQEVADALFKTVFDWAKARGLDHIVGPKGMSPFDGYGIQVEGTENRQMMTMMNYNYDYYPKLVETLGFEKEVDFVSCYIPADKFHLDERINLIAKRVIERGSFKVIRFKNKAELIGYADQIGEAYNKTFVNNWEYYPLTKKEIKFAVDQIIEVANPKLIKIITHKEEVVGFLFAFPDVSAALQRAKGKLNLFSIIDLLLELKKTKWVSLNGAGVLPEYQGRGGNALLYHEMEKTLHDFNFDHADLTQVAETTKQMRKDLENVGGRAYKNHRVYHKHLA
jgi:GNAT superfamily N-acetyltransferase